MYVLNNNNIYELPIHDSDLLGINIFQSSQGLTHIKLGISFYSEELHLLDKRIIELLGQNNDADLLISNCSRIKFDGYYNTDALDLFDFVELSREHSLLEEHANKISNRHISITFISGSVLECIYEKIGLVSRSNKAIEQDSR